MVNCAEITNFIRSEKGGLQTIIVKRSCLASSKEVIIERANLSEQNFLTQI